MIQSDKTHFQVASLTHAGMTGKNNEDRYAVSSFRLGENDPTQVLLAVLSDGIGGHRAGEVASQMAVDTITRQVAASDGQDPLRIMQEAVQSSSQEIRKEAQSNADWHGMGATCVLTLIIGRRVYAATVGDSRLYLMRGGKILQLSTDHTWIQEAMDAGLIQPEEAVGHPNAHVIRRYLGSSEPPQVDFRLRLTGDESDTQAMSNQGFALYPGDCLLLCSDGLTDLVKDHEILAAFSRNSLEAGVQSLVNLANQRGGHDNITIVTIQAPGIPAKKGKRLNWKPFIVAGLVLLGMMVVGLSFLMGYLWYTGRENPPGGSAVPSGQGTLSVPLLQTQPVIMNTAPVSAPSAEPLASATAIPPFPLPESGAVTLTPWPTHTLEVLPTTSLPTP